MVPGLVTDYGYPGVISGVSVTTKKNFISVCLHRVLREVTPLHFPSDLDETKRCSSNEWFTDRASLHSHTGVTHSLGVPGGRVISGER